MIKDSILNTKCLDTFSTIDNHLCAIDKSALIASQIKTHIRNIICLSEATQWNIPNELLSVLGSIFHSSEHREKPSSGEEGSNTVDSNIVGTILRSETLGSLDRQSAKPFSSCYISQLTFVTAPLEALYHTNPGRGRLAPVEEMLITDPP